MLKIEIEKFRGINHLELDLPFEKGLFAISGENAVGKSTLFNVLSKLVYRSAFSKYLSKEGTNESFIKLSIGQEEETWERVSNKWQKTSSSNTDDIFINGFYEGSLIYGNRFSDADKKLLTNVLKIQNQFDYLKDADNLIVENLGYILKGDKDFYNGLKVIKNKSNAEKFGFKNIPYFWERDGNLVSQMFMSSGEFLLINLLHFINERIKYTNKKGIKDLSLVLLDEIELALHPIAQKRLADFLRNISNKHNFCVYFATHSLQIISELKPSSLFHLEFLSNRNIRVVNPCYPAYATRNMYTPDGFDFIILVEDTLAKALVEETLGNIMTKKFYKLVKIIPCGGWEKVLELHKEFKTSGIAGIRCRFISILDKDIESEYNQKYADKKEIASLTKLFLPIYSVEKALKDKLIDNFDVDFYDAINNSLYNVRSLDDILKDYKQRTKKDNDGKALYMVLQACYNEQSTYNDNFDDKIISIILSQIDTTKFTQSIEQVLN